MVHGDPLSFIPPELFLIQTHYLWGPDPRDGTVGVGPLHPADGPPSVVSRRETSRARHGGPLPRVRVGPTTPRPTEDSTTLRPKLRPTTVLQPSLVTGTLCSRTPDPDDQCPSGRNRVPDSRHGPTSTPQGRELGLVWTDWTPVTWGEPRYHTSSPSMPLQKFGTSGP